MVLDLLLRCPCGGHLTYLEIRVIYKLSDFVQEGKELMSQVKF